MEIENGGDWPYDMDADDEWGWDPPEEIGRLQPTMARVTTNIGDVVRATPAVGRTNTHTVTFNGGALQGYEVDFLEERVERELDDYIERVIWEDPDLPRVQRAAEVESARQDLADDIERSIFRCRRKSARPPRMLTAHAI